MEFKEGASNPKIPKRQIITYVVSWENKNQSQ